MATSVFYTLVPELVGDDSSVPRLLTNVPQEFNNFQTIWCLFEGLKVEESLQVWAAAEKRVDKRGDTRSRTFPTFIALFVAFYVAQLVVTTSIFAQFRRFEQFQRIDPYMLDSSCVDDRGEAVEVATSVCVTPCGTTILTFIEFVCFNPSSSTGFVPNQHTA